VVGADGVTSLVARSQGLGVRDRRCTVVARRAYAAGAAADVAGDGAEVFFDKASFPGYSWVFPLGGGRVNLGVGVLSEARERAGVRMPELLDRFVERLRERHPAYGGLELVSKPIGGIVSTYGAAGPNHFDGGVLIGDAGSFVDPMTGEGITQAMESALLAVPALLDALERGGDRAVLAAYERAFRSYFDPSMLFLAFCAQMLRNRHLRGPWLKALARGCQVAQRDGDFARTSGSYFGGLEIRPLDIIGQVWQRSLVDLLLAWPRFLAGERAEMTTPGDLLQWQVALGVSVIGDPGWHIGWALDMEQAWARLLAGAATHSEDPRPAGPPLLR
jgi:flavin-dependent dehydrogenase